MDINNTSNMLDATISYWVYHSADNEGKLILNDKQMATVYIYKKAIEDDLKKKLSEENDRIIQEKVAAIKEEMEKKNQIFLNRKRDEQTISMLITLLVESILLAFGIGMIVNQFTDCISYIKAGAVPGEQAVQISVIFIVIFAILVIGLSCSRGYGLILKFVEKRNMTGDD